jgi:hypothetical protein
MAYALGVSDKFQGTGVWSALKAQRKQPKAVKNNKPPRPGQSNKR